MNLLVALIYLIIWFAILGGVIYLLHWLCGYLPEPFQKVCRVIVIIVGVCIGILILINFMGGMPLPRLSY